MEIIEDHKKYYFIIFIIVFLITVFIASFSWAYNPDVYLDDDKDGLSNYQEKAIYQTFWYDADSDKDGYNDGLEVANGYSPKQAKLKMREADTDNDGLNDAWEIKLGTNLMLRDTDNDGYLDSTEIYNNYSPTDSQATQINKRIEVSTTDLNLKFFINDILVDTFPVSTGKPTTPTPLGEFKIIAKYPIKHYNNLPNTKWNMHFATVNGLRYYIHGAYWHDKFGQETVSGGCVNVRYEDMEPFYNLTSIGTPVIIN
ncbi:MAG: L,D-transpeptidase family protein [Candidatus Buchananbacteria bacterium]|nr:L,D-transpeptidase family protein [Candidatus Buchananbacteria bacterium]